MLMHKEIVWQKNCGYYSTLYLAKKLNVFQQNTRQRATYSWFFRPFASDRSEKPIVNNKANHTHQGCAPCEPQAMLKVVNIEIPLVW